MPATIVSLRQSLVAPSGTDTGVARPAWLEQAVSDPAQFWSDHAADLAAAAPGTCRSALFEWYDLFYEFAERHADGSRAAFRDYSPALSFRDTSYTTLCTRARSLAAAWASSGVGPRSTVYVVCQVSSAYVTFILAAWYCGATVTIVPPDGSSFVCWALKAAGADRQTKPGAPCQVFIVADAEAKPWLLGFGQVRQLSREVNGGSPPAAKSFRFPAGAVAARLFSPIAVDCSQPLELSAEQVYLSALRDGILLLQLGPGEALAAPGFSALQFKPALILSALASGATWTELGAEELGDGRALIDGKVDVLGVTAVTRALLLPNQRLGKAKLRRWFRNVAEDSDTNAWREWSSVLAPLGIVGMNYFVNAAAGGSLLFSSWSPHSRGAFVWRSPGLPCKLVEPNGTGMPRLSDLGLLAPDQFPKTTPGIRQGLSEGAVGQLVLAVPSSAAEVEAPPTIRPGTAEPSTSDILIMNLGSHRSGVVLSEPQIEAVLQAKYPKWVRAAVLVALPTHSREKRGIAALLVFVDPTEPGVAAHRLEEYLRTELGVERVPDRVEVFELNPKLVDPKVSQPEVNRAACRAQYVSGSLWGKTRAPVFRQLAVVFKDVIRARDYPAPPAKTTRS